MKPLLKLVLLCLLLKLVLLCLCINFATAAAASQSAERDALLAFQIGVKNPELLRLWNNSTLTPCSWVGVSCSPEGYVVGVSLAGLPLHGVVPAAFSSLTELRLLNLSSTNLTGTIPDLQACTRLEVLDLSVNSLSGRIPATLGLLRQLRVLNLQDNQLEGPIPPEIGNCTALEQLQLYDNQLSGSIPPEVGQLVSLQVFRAGGNLALSGSLPPQLSNCKNLTVLGLAVTALTGSIPASYGELVNLENLVLYGASLSGHIPPEIGGCSKLQTIYLHENRLTGPLPSTIGKLQELRILLLWQNLLSGHLPPEIGQCQQIEIIDLSSNDLSGPIPPELGGLQNLKQFYLTQNNITGSIPPELGNCTSMTQLELDNNQLTGSIPPTFGQMTSLRLLHLWQNKLTGSIPATLGQCKDLEVLDLTMNRLSGSIPAELFNLTKLQRLLLLYNNLTGSLPSTVGNCIGLQRLRVNNNELTGTIPDSLGQLRNLNFLDLHANKITGLLPPSISKLNSLQLLDVHDNQLSGPFPAEYGSLLSLEILDASCNNLSGSIPADIGRMNLLSQLNLSSNHLSGSIPAQVGSCKELLLLDLSNNELSGSLPPELGMVASLTITLDLHNNRLSGFIPAAFSHLAQLEKLDISMNDLTGNLDVLGKLNSLNFVNVSYNHFSGSLPNSQVFQTMSYNSFMGNPGLCSSSSAVEPCSLSYSIHSRKTAIKPVIGLLFGGAAIILFMGLILLYKKCHPYKDHNFRDQQSNWPWKMTLFQRLSFNVEDVLQNLVETNIIGEGRSGVVYKATMPSGEVVAVKKLKRSEQNHCASSSEINTLGKIRHRNIVRLLGYCSKDKVELLMYDYMPNGSLAEFLQEKKAANSWDVRYRIALGAAQGLAYLHHDCLPPILHRDIKPSNILLDSKYEPYVADFGLARFLSCSGPMGDAISKVAGSYGYMAPEYSYTLNITEKSDVYSYGVVLLQLLTGRSAVMQDVHITKWVQSQLTANQPSIDVLDCRLKGMADPFIEEMLQILGVALMCVSNSPADRPTMKDVVAFLQEVKHVPDEASSMKASSVSDQMPLFKEKGTSSRHTSTYELVFNVDHSSSQSAC